MAWQNPKKNWVAGDIPGAGDFNRIEGNAEYLKTQTDGLKSGSIKAGDADTVDGVHARIIVPSTANLLSATAERYTPDSDTKPAILKRFKLGYPGICILRYQYRGGGNPAAPAKFTAELWMNNKKYQEIGSVETGADEYSTYEAEVRIPFPAMEIVIWGQSGTSSSSIYRGRVRNAYIRGSLIQIDPNFQVVVN